MNCEADVAPTFGAQVTVAVLRESVHLIRTESDPLQYIKSVCRTFFHEACR